MVTGPATFSITSLCGAFNLTPPAGTAPYVNLQAFNLASIFTDGFDIEASYQFDVAKLGLPGRVVLRGLATNVKNFITDPGVPGTIPTQGAGVNAGNTPSWKLLTTESWTTPERIVKRLIDVDAGIGLGRRCRIMIEQIVDLEISVQFLGDVERSAHVEIEGTGHRVVVDRRVLRGRATSRHRRGQHPM